MSSDGLTTDNNTVRMLSDFSVGAGVQVTIPTAKTLVVIHNFPAGSRTVLVYCRLSSSAVYTVPVGSLYYVFNTITDHAVWC